MRNDRKRILILFLLGFYIVGQSFVFPMSVSTSSQSLLAASDGGTDVIILPGETRTYEEGNFVVNGSIVVIGGTLALLNATLKILQSSAFQYNLTFIDGFLEATNSKLTSEYNFNIYFYGESFMKASELDSGLSRLFFRDRSKADLSGFSTRGFLRAYSSTVLNIADSTLNPALRDLSKETAVLETRGSSIVAISRTTMREASSYDASTVSISDSNILYTSLPLRVYNSSRVTMKNSKGQVVIEGHDSSSVLIFSTSLKRFLAFDASLASLTDSTISEGLSAYGLSQVFVYNSQVADEVSLSAYLATYDSTVVWIFGTKIKGLFSTNGASKVTVTSSVLESLNVDDSSSVIFSKSQIASLYGLGDHSKIYLSASNVTSLHLFASSYLSLVDSSVALLRTHQSSTVSALQSVIEDIYVYNREVTGSIANLNLGKFSSWNYYVNGSIGVAPGGYAPNITLVDTEIKGGWNLFFINSPDVNITDSTLDYLDLSGSSLVRLEGSLLSSYEISGGTMQVYWRLQVKGPSNATITVLDSNGTIVESMETDVSGIAAFLLAEKVVDAAGMRTMNSYTVDVASKDFSGSQKVVMTSNQEIVLLPSAPLWLQVWQQYWYVVVVFVVAMSIVLYYVMMKRRNKSKVV